jgi:ribose/xylose/arabinose/galactoside ABC-type transport system permease subunit
VGCEREEVTSAEHQPSRPANRLASLAASEYLVPALCLVYFAALAPFAEGFASAGNFSNILLTLLPLFLLALGQTVVLITAGIDLSVTATVALTSVIGGMVMSGDNGWLANSPVAGPAGIAAMIATGALVGLLNGWAVALLRMPPFIVTLTTMMFVGGFAVWLTRSENLGSLPSRFTALGNELWLSLPLSLLAALFAHLMLSRSLPGRWLYAVGQNARAARVSGVPVAATICGAYVVSGVCAALASVLLTGQAQTGSPVLGRNLLLDVIGAAVIGGTSLFGGKGKVLWTLFGVLLLKLIDNSLNLLNLSDWDIRIIKGGVILFAALMDAVRTRFVVRGF